MTTEPIADWAAARSDKWRRHLAGLEAMLAPIDDPLITGLTLDTPARLADVGCGSGATTIAVLRNAPSGSVVHGYDLSPALIEVARRRHGANVPSVSFEVADMATATPPAPRYDRLLSRMGIMFFDHPAEAFSNLHRWLAPRGRFAFAVWGPPRDNIWMATTRAAVAEFVALPSADASAPGPFRYGDADTLRSLLHEAGFVDVEAADWRGLLPIGRGLGALDAAQFAIASFSTFAERLAEAGGDAQARARDSLAARFAEHERDGSVSMPARVHIVTGMSGTR